MELTLIEIGRLLALCLNATQLTFACCAPQLSIRLQLYRYQATHRLIHCCHRRQWHNSRINWQLDKHYSIHNFSRASRWRWELHNNRSQFKLFILTGGGPIENENSFRVYVCVCGCVVEGVPIWAGKQSKIFHQTIETSCLNRIIRSASVRLRDLSSVISSIPFPSKWAEVSATWFQQENTWTKSRLVFWVLIEWVLMPFRSFRSFR